MSASEYLFQPHYSVVQFVDPLAPIEALEREQGMYSATPEFVKLHGGEIANRILQSVPSWYYYYDEADARVLSPNIDVRIHRLYPGDYPAYPGWHCDGEFRETYFAQPDMDRINVSRHVTCTVSSDINGVSGTEFLDEELIARVVDPSVNHTFWGQVDRQLRAAEKLAPLKTTIIPDGHMVVFDARTLHRATETRVRGWRLFFRMSMWHRPNLGGGGMLTKQEQVYTTTDGRGW